MRHHHHRHRSDADNGENIVPQTILEPRPLLRNAYVAHTGAPGRLQHSHFKTLSQSAAFTTHVERNPNSKQLQSLPHKNRPQSLVVHPHFIDHRNAFDQTDRCSLDYKRPHDPPQIVLRPSFMGRGDSQMPKYIPTVHLISYSHNHVIHHSSISSLLSDLLPPYTTHLYTIRAGHFDKPPKPLWHRFSGTHPIVQEHVMEDERARYAVQDAVRDLLGEVRRMSREGTYGRPRPETLQVALSASCGAGTHRSVAIVERIKQELENALGRHTVRLRIVHVHRSKGDHDPY